MCLGEKFAEKRVKRVSQRGKEICRVDKIKLSFIQAMINHKGVHHYL